MEYLGIVALVLVLAYVWPWLIGVPLRFWASLSGFFIGRARVRSGEPIRIIIRNVPQTPNASHSGTDAPPRTVVSIEGVSELLEDNYRGRIDRATAAVNRLDSAHGAVRAFLSSVQGSIVTERLMPAADRLQGAIGDADSWLAALAFTLGVGFVVLDSVLFGEFVESLAIPFGTGPLPLLHGLKVYHLLGLSLTIGVILALFAVSRVGAQRRWLYPISIVAVMLVVFGLRLGMSLNATSTGIPVGTYWLDALFSFVWAASAVGVHELLRWIFTHCTRTAALVGCCILGAAALLVLTYFGVLVTFIFRSVLFGGWMILYQTARMRCAQQGQSAAEQKEAVHQRMVETILRSGRQTIVEERGGPADEPREPSAAPGDRAPR